jgi:LemA protein
MEIFTLLLTALFVVLFLGGVFIYNALVRDRNRVLAAWSDISVQLKRRHDLLPKLVDAVKQYAAYEQATLSAVIELRTQSEHTSALADKGRLEMALGAGMRQLLAVAEQYPELKANQNFLALQRDITAVEDHLQYARRYYNGAVRNLNTRIDSFPDLLLARLFRYSPQEYFALESDAERHAPEVR